MTVTNVSDEPMDVIPDDDPVLKQVFDWLIELLEAVRGNGDLDALLPYFRVWLNAAPERRAEFAAVERKHSSLCRLANRDFDPPKWGL